MGVARRRLGGGAGSVGGVILPNRRSPGAAHSLARILEFGERGAAGATVEGYPAAVRRRPWLRAAGLARPGLALAAVRSQPRVKSS